MVCSWFSPACDLSLRRENVKMADILQPKLDDRMITQLLNSARLPQNIVICQCPADYLRLRQMIYLLANDDHDILLNLVQLLLITIPCKFFFPFIVQEPTTWPANKCLQIMLCSCPMSSNCKKWLQIIFCSCVFFLLLAIALVWKWHLPEDI